MATDPRSLVGGHATGSLSADERRELYRAALEDQALFDTLADEEALRELVEDPAMRQRLRAAVAGDEPARRGFAWFLASDWLPAAAALLLAAALVPLAARLFEQRGPAGGTGIVRVAEPDPDAAAPASAAEWAASVDRPLTDEGRLAVAAAAPKDFEPLGTSRRSVLRLRPDRAGRVMAVGIDARGDVEKLYPPGDAEWEDVEADVPITIALPESASRFVEFRLVIVARGADVGDLPARLGQGTAVVYRVRPN